MTQAVASTPAIRVGIGGWTFEPWRNNFYPEGLPLELQARMRRACDARVGGGRSEAAIPA